MTQTLATALPRLLQHSYSYLLLAICTVALKVALCAMRSATISYASCAMCYALCDDFLCVVGH